MFALWPILPLAFTAFALSVAYEGEIYLQNITGAWNKLFKFKHLERQLAKRFLLDNFPKNDACPEFFKDYDKQLKLVHAFEHKSHQRLNQASQARKKREEKILADMEKWFALLLFREEDQEQSEYVREVRAWLNETTQKIAREETILTLAQHSKAIGWMKKISALAGVFMTFGTTYLLIEAFSAIPFFATIAFTTWPLFIIPMALIAGMAYGLLTYNAITDMYNSDTVNKWLIDLHLRKNPHSHQQEKSITRSIFAIGLVALALMLTVCTAGTWWTVVKETRPLFLWMSKLPNFIMGVIHPLITGFSAVVFNLQNTHESLELIMSSIKDAGKHLYNALAAIPKGLKTLYKNENILQIINPARLLLTLTILPLRILLFVGHLISIGVTADRLPGVSTLFSALMGIISECFEDIHYFFGHSEAGHSCGHHEHHQHHQHHQHHEHHEPQPDERISAKKLREARLKEGAGHHHDLDIPTWLIESVFGPAYHLAAFWNCLFSQLNQNPEKRLSLSKAQEKMGFKQEIDKNLVPTEEKPSTGWILTHAIQRLTRYKEKQLGGLENSGLAKLQTNLQGKNEVTKDQLNTVIFNAKETINPHNFFAVKNFLNTELPERLHLAPIQP